MSAEDLGVRVPTVSVPLILDLVVEICKGTTSQEGWLDPTSAVGSALLYAVHSPEHVFNRWRYVSLEEKALLQGPLVEKSINTPV